MHLRVRSEALESDVRQKDKEIESLNQRLEDQANLYSSSVKSEDKLKVCALPPVTQATHDLLFDQILLNENETLRSQLSRLNDQCAGRSPDKQRKVMLDQLNQRLSHNVHELRTIQNELNNLLNTS